MINYGRPLESGNLNNPKDISHCVLEDNAENSQIGNVKRTGINSGDKLLSLILVYGVCLF